MGTERVLPIVLRPKQIAENMWKKTKKTHEHKT